MKRLAAAATTALMVAFASGDGHAAGGTLAPAQKWSFGGVFGTFDRGDLQRGLQVYRSVCSNCHSLKLIAFRNLEGLGLSPEEVQAIAGEYEVTDGPDDEGEMYSRAARAADRFPSPFANDQAARASNGGALPPDLSLITKGRAGESVFKGTKFREYGADYVYALMTGYEEEPPEGVTLMDGMHYNHYFPGHQIAMAPPLFDEAVEYTDGTEATLQQHAHDIATFLAWAADPNAEERKRIGIKAILFVTILSVMLYAVKKKIWSDLH
ncbi:MAG: cytochrome c1 [Rhodospirillales bacterium]|nr:cytochrome c1 [Rhodospirillales bacterium]